MGHRASIRGNNIVQRQPARHSGLGLRTLIRYIYSIYGWMSILRDKLRTRHKRNRHYKTKNPSQNKHHYPSYARSVPEAGYSIFMDDVESDLSRCLCSGWFLRGSNAVSLV